MTPFFNKRQNDLNFKLKIVAEGEAVVHKWENQQHMLFNGKLKMTAKHASMGWYKPKYPELDQCLADWFSDQRSQGTIKNCFVFNLH